MIDKVEMMSVLLGACPSFGPQWQTFVDEWQVKIDEQPLYIALGDFARHLIDLLERGDRQPLVVAFEAIERLHVEGIPYVREAASVGLLENLQNANLHRRTQPEDFISFLGPESTKSWKELNRFWSGQLGHA